MAHYVGKNAVNWLAVIWQAALGMLASADACCLRNTVIFDGDVNDKGQNLVTLRSTCTRSIPRGVHSTVSRAALCHVTRCVGLP
jgi:hypothetical protein